MINFLSIFRNFNFSEPRVRGLLTSVASGPGPGLIIENLSQAFVTLGGDTADKINYSGEEPFLYLSSELSRTDK